MNKIAKVISEKIKQYNYKSNPRRMGSLQQLQLAVSGVSNLPSRCVKLFVGKKFNLKIFNSGFLEWPARWLATLLAPSNTQPIMRQVHVSLYEPVMMRNHK